MTPFETLRRHNPIVAAITRAGGTAEDCAVHLAAQNEKLMSKIIELEGIAPRRYKLDDGRKLIWRCPDHLVPETDLSQLRGMEKLR